MLRRSAISHLTPVLAATLLLACGGRDDAGWSTLDESKLSGTQRGQVDEARDARDALFRGLFAALTASRSEVGAAGSIEVCREVAPRLAREVAAETGVAIGRTSIRLRNRANAAPDWAAPMIDARVAVESDAFAAHDDGRLAALLPIFVMPQCLACHGGEDQLEDGVADALARVYPDDAATGFAEGDLRGWFWVEVPAAENRSDR